MLRKTKLDSEAVSEVVGALMLTLIVVVAASSFALFVSDKQKAVQEHELIKLKRELETLSITNIKPYAYQPDSWSTLNFTIANLHTEDSTILSLSINGFPVKSFKVTRYNSSSGSYQSTDYMFYDDLVIDSRQQINLEINVSEDMFDSRFAIGKEQYVELEIHTALTNTFSRVFVPPDALIRIETETYWNYSSSNYSHYLILDGSKSSHPGDGFIVSWHWTVEPEGVGCSGQRVVAPISLSDQYHTITLTVTDNFGFTDSESFVYYY